MRPKYLTAKGCFDFCLFQIGPDWIPHCNVGLLLLLLLYTNKPCTTQLTCDPLVLSGLLWRNGPGNKWLWVHDYQILSSQMLWILQQSPQSEVFSFSDLKFKQVICIWVFINVHHSNNPTFHCGLKGCKSSTALQTHYRNPYEPMESVQSSSYRGLPDNHKETGLFPGSLFRALRTTAGAQSIYGMGLSFPVETQANLLMLKHAHRVCIGNILAS